MNDDNANLNFLEWAVAARRQFASDLESGIEKLEPLLRGLRPFEQKLLLRELLVLQFQHKPPTQSDVEVLKQRLPTHRDVIEQVWIDWRSDPSELDTHSLNAPDHGTNDGERNVNSDPNLTLDLDGWTPDEREDAQASRIGDYEILGELGRGGMGIVFKARQRSANRVVALKVIRADRLSSFDDESRQAVIDRFQAEAQAAAKLDHDNIVVVYDVGAAGGERYYSMRYVEGNSLSQVLADGPMDGIQAAKYITGVCRAIDAAHQEKILHRDLKPSNIIIDARTDRALVADFGLAKLLTIEQSATQTGAIMGTPPYMAPEQTQDASKVDERADIYGIGATLYHLLTGRPPFQTPSIAETIRQVNSEEPVAPRRLNPAVNRDLETICLKCLEKTPAARYQSAHAIELELARFLRGEPIEARPIGRFRKLIGWAAKNRTTATLLGVSLGLLLALLATSTWGYFAVSNALGREQEARKRADEQTQKAEENLQVAFEATDKAFTRIATDSRLRSYDLEELRRDLLKDVIPFLDRFAAESPDTQAFEASRAVALKHLATVQREMGESESAHVNLDKAIEALEKFDASAPSPTSLELAATLAERSKVLLARAEFDPAMTDMQRALKIFAQAYRDTPENLVAAQGLAMLHGNIAVALATYRPEQVNDARVHFEQAIQIREAYRKTHPTHAANLYNLALAYTNFGNFLIDRGRLAECESAYQDGLGVLDANIPALQRFHNLRLARAALNYQLGLLSQTLQKFKESESYFAAAVSDGAELSRTHPTMPDYAYRWAKSGIALAVARQSAGKPNKEIDAALGDAVETLRSLIRENPDEPEYRMELTRALDVVGIQHQNASRVADHERVALECLEIRRQLALEFPNRSEYKWMVAKAHFNLGVVYDHKNNVVKQESHYVAAVTTLKEVHARDKTSAKLAVDVTHALNNLIVMYVENNREAEAAAYVREMKPLLDSLPKTHPEALLNIGRLRITMGEGFLKKGNLKQAEPYLSSAIETLTQLKQLAPSTDVKVLLALAFMSRAEVHGKNGEIEAGSKDWDEAIKNSPADAMIELQVRRARWFYDYAREKNDSK